MRQLTGRLEELNFQMLQLQEQIRRQQEDNEFRFQQLEDQKQGSLRPADTEPERDLAAAPAADGDSKSDRFVVEQATSSSEGAIGAPPSDLGTLTIGDSGAVISSGIDFSQNGVGTRPSTERRWRASMVLLTPIHFIIWAMATSCRATMVSRRNCSTRFSNAIRTIRLRPDAGFWLGESVLASGRLEDAAEIFIDMRARYPHSDKAPETMLKIGSIMADLGNRDVACVTFADALTTHTDMAVAVQQRILERQAQERC